MKLDQPSHIRAKVILEIASGVGTIVAIYAFGLSHANPLTFSVVCAGMVLAGVWRGFGHVQTVVTRTSLIRSGAFIALAVAAVWALDGLARSEVLSELSVAVLISSRLVRGCRRRMPSCLENE